MTAMPRRMLDRHWDILASPYRWKGPGVVRDEYNDPRVIGNLFHINETWIAEALTTYAHLEGYHAHEWDRFVIEAPDFRTAGRVAAGLGWWLHCWWWEFSEDGIVIRDSTGRHAHDPLCGW